MEPFVGQLRDLCTSWPTRAKWVFVPTHAVGRTLGDRLVLGGTNWANLRFITPLDVALRMGAPFLVERGIDPSEEGLGPALVMRLLMGVHTDEPYFRPLASQPTMAVALWSTLRELRMAGLRAADLPADAFASSAKHAELSALLNAYETYLSTTARGDMATVFEEALAHPDWCPLQPDDCWLALPDEVWSPLQRRLIDAMPGERLRPVALAVPGAEVPRRLRGDAVDRQVAVARGAVHFFHAGGAEAEVEETFRRVLQSASALDAVEIVCASPQYSTLVWEKAIRYDWPITVAQGLPATLTRPGRALLSFTEWIEDNFAAGRLRRMLQSGDVAPGEAVPVSSGQAARLLVKAQAAWGRRTYRLALGRLAQSSRTAAARDDLNADAREGLTERARHAEALASWIDALITGVPVPDEAGTVDLQQVATCARAFVDGHAARASALDAYAAVSLGEAIGELRALGDFRCPLDQALRFLRERLESVRIGADRPRPGHLHVTPLAGAGRSGRSRVFVLGLEEGRVFPAPFEDPILLDAERTRISPLLSRAGDRIDEAVYSALGRLAAIAAAPNATITMSYSCRDLREYRQTYASWVLLQAYRAATGDATRTFHDLQTHLGPAASCVPGETDAALGEARWWLRGITRAGAPSRAAVLARYPPLSAGVVAHAARASAAFTEFDGHVPAAGLALDPCAATRVVSPTQLEDAARCPFRYFLRRGLNVDAIESGERDRDVWLDALLRGSLLHDLYAALMRHCRAEGRRVQVPEDREWLLRLGRQRLEALEEEMPPPSEEVRERETRLFLEDLQLFATAEAAADPARTPIGFEVAFGRADALDDEPLAQDDPVVIDAGGGVTLRLAGRIDRIDRTGAGTYEIVDYKTGGYWADDWKGVFAGGKRLQHALYGLAALALLKGQDASARIAGAEYYFSSAKGQQERKRIPAPAGATFGAVLGDLREVIAGGLFIHAADMNHCKWCDFGHACRDGAAADAEAKSADPVLAPLTRLKSHE